MERRDDIARSSPRVNIGVILGHVKVRQHQVYDYEAKKKGGRRKKAIGFV